MKIQKKNPLAFAGPGVQRVRPLSTSNLSNKAIFVNFPRSKGFRTLRLLGQSFCQMHNQPTGMFAVATHARSKGRGLLRACVSAKLRKLFFIKSAGTASND